MKIKILMIVSVIILAIIVVNNSVFAEDESDNSFETIDGFKLFDDISLVIQKYGQPSSKKESGFCLFGEDDEGSVKFEYKQKGMTFEVCEGEIEEIHVYGKSTAKTSKGIGIGSTGVKVIKSYGEPTRSSARYVDYAQSPDPCLTFLLRNGKVSEIILSSSMAGCEGS